MDDDYCRQTPSRRGEQLAKLQSSYKASSSVKPGSIDRKWICNFETNVRRSHPGPVLVSVCLRGTKGPPAAIPKAHIPLFSGTIFRPVCSNDHFTVLDTAIRSCRGILVECARLAVINLGRESATEAAGMRTQWNSR